MLDRDFTKDKELGDLYMDYVTYCCSRFGMSINSYSTKKFQWTYGEGASGVEIKYDHLFNKSKRLYLEFKATTKNGDKFINGGITFDDKSNYYLIGDFATAYLLPKKALIPIIDKVKINSSYYEKRNTKICETKDSNGNVLSVGLCLDIELAYELDLIRATFNFPRLNNKWLEEDEKRKKHEEIESQKRYIENKKDTNNWSDLIDELNT